MFSFKALIESVVEQGRRTILQATRSKINSIGNFKSLKLSEAQTSKGIGRSWPKGPSLNQQGVTEIQRTSLNSASLVSPGGGIARFLRPVTTRLFQGLVRKVSSPLWTEAKRKSAKRLFGETAPYFALVGVTLVSGPERGLLTAQDELEAVCCDIREAISRIGWIHNPYYWKETKANSTCLSDATSDNGFSLSDFELGSSISKGCSAVVYAAKWKNVCHETNPEDKTKSEDKAKSDDPHMNIAQELIRNPPKIVDSLENIYASEGLLSLGLIQGSDSSDSADEENTSRSLFGNHQKQTSKDSLGAAVDKLNSVGATLPSQIYEYDLFNDEANFTPNSSSIEEFLSLGECHSTDSLNGSDLTTSSSRFGSALRSANSVSLPEDLDISHLIQDAAFVQSGDNSLKRKKVKFKDESIDLRDEEDNQRLYPINEEPSKCQDVSSPIETFPLAMKMMFNYEAESNAPAILTAMYKEMIPAKALQLDDTSTLWKQRLLNTTTTLPPHVNIVDMPCVFVDRVPLMPDGFCLYPDALPKRLNPSGYGRNMSLFCIMKRYNCTLAEYLSQQSINTRTSLLLFTQLLEAVLHINKFGVAHRDLKSDNVLLCLREGRESPHLVLSDFGCCLPVPNLKVAFSSYETDPRVGNAALMAPEIKCATPGLLTWLNYNKSDLWSAGAIAYEIFGHENPFTPRHYETNDSSIDSSKKRLILDSSTYKESQLPRLPKTIPTEIINLVHDILRRNPKQRPSPTVAATICQLSLWAPRKWLNRHALAMPSNNEVMSWLLCLSTKVICEAGSSSNSLSDRGNGSDDDPKKLLQEKTRGYLEYEIVSTFLRRVQYRDIIQAIKWIRTF